MSTRRYEILLPLRYNDGSLVEQEKFYQTQEELVNAFGALTTSPEQLQGIWIHEGQRFQDVSLRLTVDVEATASNRAFFQSLKEKLKERFRQLEIWIISYDIEIV